MTVPTVRTGPGRALTLAAATMLAAGVVLAPTAAAQAASACGVTYQKTWDNGSAFGATVTISNGGSPVDSWMLAFSFAGEQRVTNGWPVTWTQAAGSNQVTAASNARWNGRLAAGGKISIGFNGAYRGENPNPTAFTLNGVACNQPAVEVVDNPYLGARGYVNPEWSAQARAEPGGGRIADQPTAVWLDSIASIHGIPDGAANVRMGLADHLDRAVAQAAGHPTVVQLVLANLPGRNCDRVAPNSELGPGDLPRYRAEFVDPIAEILARPAYAKLRIVTLVEPGSLPNLITNVVPMWNATVLCETMRANGGYVQGIGYAVAKLGALPNVYSYLDAAHHGEIGWAEPFTAMAQLLARAARAGGGTLASVRGFVTNTANYSALQEPFVAADAQTRLSRWVDHNQFNDELSFAQAFRTELVRVGFSAGIGMVVDTSRNGWGGPARPTAPVSSFDINTFVDGSRIDRRFTKENYCNQSGAGLGERPRAAPVDGVHAYAWIKPPGESDGASQVLLDDIADRMCDPFYTGPPRGSSSRTGALPGAPPGGVWFSAQFQELMRNAFPAL